MGVLAYVALGTAAFLGTKSFQCSKQCSGAGGGCCSMAFPYGLMAVAATDQGLKMLDKKKSLTKTCVDLSSTGFCNPKNPDNPEENPDEPSPPDPLPPGCELNMALCNPDIYSGCLPGDSNCNPSEPGLTPGLPPASGSITGGVPASGSITGGVPNSVDVPRDISDILAEAFKPEGGWPEGKNPFEGNEKFEYDNLNDEQKAQINDAMKGFNQRKKDYMAKNGLLGSGSDSDSSKNGKNSDSSKNGKNKGDLLAENLSDELDLSTGFPKIKENSPGSLAGNQASNRRRRTAGRNEPNTIDKMQEMLKKMRGGANNNNNQGDLSNMSVSIGNDNVGVREDNIFLMVHRLNRKLDEDQRRFIIDF